MSLDCLKRRGNGSENITIESSADFIKVAPKGIKDTILFELTAGEINYFNEKYPIFTQNVPSIPGIAKIHLILCTSNMQVEVAPNRLHQQDFIV